MMRTSLPRTSSTRTSFARTAIAIVIAASIAACGGGTKDQGPAASGPLTAAERDLIAHVPAGASAVFGGDLLAAQRWLAGSAFARLAPGLGSPAAAAWNGCLAETPVASAGAATAQDGDVVVRVFFSGLTIDRIEQCARTARARCDVDPDRRFARVGIDTGGQALIAPFLAVDGGVYAQLSVPLRALLGGRLAAQPATRADLEADVATLAQASAATEARFTPVLERLDRGKTLWFAGDATGTDLGGDAGALHGTVDVRRGLALDVTATLRPDGTAARLHRRFTEARNQLDMVPVGFAAVKELVRSIKLSRDGESLHVVTDFRAQALDEVMEQVGDRFLRRR